MTMAVSTALASRVDDPDDRRGGIEDEGELAALRHQHRPFQRLAVVGAGDPRDAVDDQHLQDHVGRHADRDELPVGGDHPKIERHADAEEEEAEQQPAERLDVGLELVTEGTFGEEDAGEEGAHGHREPAGLEQDCRPEDDQEGGRRHHLARAEAGEQAEHRIEQVAAGEHQRRDGGKAERDGRRAARPASPLLRPARGRRRAPAAGRWRGPPEAGSR